MSAEDHKSQAKASQGPIQVAIVTVSDTRTPETDTSGQLIRQICEEAGHRVAHYRIVKDEPVQVAQALDDFADGSAQLILFHGGTGISQRDRTYDVLAGRLEKVLPGFGEIFRMLSYQEIGSAAMMSRATAGTYRGVVVVSMPGSRNAVGLAMTKLVLPEIEHLAWEITR
jgi:molybdenum cofactor biosynthesis protein B